MLKSPTKEVCHPDEGGISANRPSFPMFVTPVAKALVMSQLKMKIFSR